MSVQCTGMHASIALCNKAASWAAVSMTMGVAAPEVVP
jgi:hypothetical protein